MSHKEEPEWLVWARDLQAISQTGLTFVRDPYDKERYEMIRALSARMMAKQSGHEYEKIETLFCEQTGYATPKIDVRGAAFQNGKILLVRELMDEGKWTLPGGWADVNQSPSECVKREILEETGYLVEVSKLAAMYDRAKHPHTPPYPFHIYKCFFVCEITGGEPKSSIETETPTFFAESEIPVLSESRVLPFQIKRMFAHYREPALKCDFD